jgi:hypothetical protein
MLIILLILILFFGLGGYSYRSNGPVYAYGGPSLGFILLIVLLYLLLGGRI